MRERDLGTITCTYLYVRMCPLFNIFSDVIIVTFYSNEPHYCAVIGLIKTAAVVISIL